MPSSVSGRGECSTPSYSFARVNDNSADIIKHLLNVSAGEEICVVVIADGGGVLFMVVLCWRRVDIVIVLVVVGYFCCCLL